MSKWLLSLVIFLMPLVGHGQVCSALFADPLSNVNPSDPVNASSSNASEANGQRPLESDYQRYLKDTLTSLEKMRGRSGLPYDKVEIETGANGVSRIWVINASTSPTNMALDLLLLANADADTASLAKIKKSLQTLARMPYHSESGLFFSWYHADQPEFVTGMDISSIDNLHLAQALWVLSKRFAGTEIGTQAGRLFARMDFSLFFDFSQNKIGGELTHSDGEWQLAAYRYDQVGSESRQLLTLGWALRLFKNVPEENFSKAIDNLDYEWFVPKDKEAHGPILRTWEGGAFQLILPELLIGEHRYSEHLKSSFENFAQFVVQEAQRRGLPLPAGHSAANYTTERDGRFGDLVPSYVGKSGSIALVDSGNLAVRNPLHRDIWESVVTPHAVFLAAYANPSLLLPHLQKAERLSSGRNRLYQPGLGWMDGYWVQPPFLGEVVNVQLSLNQGMIALSLQAMQDPERLSISARTYLADSEVQERLQDVYRRLDAKLGAGVAE